jgi:hypothetical protein
VDINGSSGHIPIVKAWWYENPPIGGTRGMIGVSYLDKKAGYFKPCITISETTCRFFVAMSNIGLIDYWEMVQTIRADR